MPAGGERGRRLVERVAVASEFRPPEIIGKDENHIGLGGACGMRRDQQPTGENCGGRCQSASEFLHEVVGAVEFAFGVGASSLIQRTSPSLP